MRTRLIPALLLAIPMCTASAACAQPGPTTEAEEKMVPMTRPDESGALTTLQTPDAEKRGNIEDWSEFRSRPTEEDVSRYAMSPPVVQDGTSITVMSAPDGFDSSAFVKMPDSTGLYMIDNVGDVEEAEFRAKAIEAMLSRDIEMEKQLTPASNATYAASFIPKQDGDLKLVNIIVAPDAVLGNTVTVAFTYE